MRSMTDEGEVDPGLIVRRVESGTRPLIRAALRPTFSPEGRRISALPSRPMLSAADPAG